MLSSFASPDTLPPHFLLMERYRILRKIGEGGFGIVYQAQDTRRKKRMVAIKQINLGALSTRQIIEATDSYNREVTLTLQALLTGKDPSDPATEADAPLPVGNKNTHQLPQFQRLLEQMQEPLPANRPRNMDDVRKKLVYIEADISAMFPLFRYWRSFVAGLLIGSLPYTFLPILSITLAIPALSNIAGIPLYMLSVLLLSMWRLLLIGQALTALLLLFKPGKRFLASGILIMLAIIYLTIHLGWLVSASQLLGRLWTW